MHVHCAGGTSSPTSCKLASFCVLPIAAVFSSLSFYSLSLSQSSTVIDGGNGKAEGRESSSPTDRPTAALHSFSRSPFPCTPIAVLLRRSPSVSLYLLLHPATISAN